MTQTQDLPILTAEEIRVLGSLMEKSRTTPEYYPMTVNSITVACNQKTSRKPVVSFDDGTVISTLDSLKKRGLVSTVTGGTSRVTKYKHNISVQYPLMPSEWTVLSLLMLRGPLTPGEINNSSARMYEYESLDEVIAILEKLSKPGPEDEPAFVVQLPKRAGQKEARYAHLLGGTDVEFENHVDASRSQGEYSGSEVSELTDRITLVEQELAALKQAFDDLMKQLT